MKRVFLFIMLAVVIVIGATAHAKVSAASTYPVNVYRFWSRNFDSAHFYTTSGRETDDLIAYSNDWTYEGVGFGAWEYDIAGCESHSAVYRFWSNAYKTHFYTMSLDEKNHVQATYPPNEWKYEGVAYCADSNQTVATGTNTPTYPLYRFWSPNFKKHFYTGNEEEAKLLYTDTNWKFEIISYYVPKSY